MHRPRVPVATLLLVEDNPADAELTREALADGADRHVVVDVYVVPNGIEALAFLRRDRAYADAPRPGLILLDLNLPRLDGRGVLADVKRDAALQDIPVVVFSSSAAADDVERAYALGASGYVVKSMHLDAFFAAVRAIRRLWTSLAAGG
ncbi:MAG: response regulator [Gemmatirosa sp.]|nr:response regulator [Gemmatirosa sp.]